jgi:hypothetical protein
MRGGLVAVGAVLVSLCVHADDASMDNDRVKAILRDMQNTSTWYHDDLAGEFAGFENYARGRYADTLRYFKLGAYYADKPSQIGIGIMYLNGNGDGAFRHG